MTKTVPADKFKKHFEKYANDVANYQALDESDQDKGKGLSPVNTHNNIFSTPDWMHYDYQNDIKADSALQPSKPVGKEVID